MLQIARKGRRDVCPRRNHQSVVAKKITDRTILGDKGIALIHRRVLDMGFIWHPRAMDAGIDGEIELRDAKSEAVLNRVILVQSKAQARFEGEDQRGFHFHCRARDRDYWLAANVPVILVCSTPDTDEAYWVHIQAWFSSPERRASTRIEINKERDRFESSAAAELLAIGSVAGTAQPLTANRTETLVSNLLPLEQMPERIFSAPCALRARDAWEKMEEAGRFAGDWIIADSRIYSFRDLATSAAKVLCDGPVTSFATSEWETSGDSDISRRFVWLLNETLREIVHRDLRWDNGRKYFFVKAPRDLEPRKFRSGRGKRTRTVFSVYLNKRDENKIAYYRHDGFARRFVRFAEQWYLEIIPTYHYTHDGERESIYAAEYLRKIKALERNAAVRDQMRMWARYLRGEETLFRRPEPLFSFGEPLTFEVDAAIDDESWTAPRMVEAPEEELQLFEDAA
jgi:hypothetical protein